MSEHRWDPDRYLRYADERGRPFHELVARVPATAPRHVVDLGCGPGDLTRSLASRWPDARILGIDSSEEMIAAALSGSASGDRPGESRRGALRFERADVRSWFAPEPVDVLLSNATLQWVPDHLELLPHLLAQVAPGGWFGFQVPGNFEEPSHRLLHRLSSDPRFSAHLEGVARPEAHDAVTYLETLQPSGCQVDAWETTYLHVLAGEDPVFTWISGTGARPALQALPQRLRLEFEAEYRDLLRQAYPPGPYGTVLRFRRVFVVARLPEEEREVRA